MTLGGRKGGKFGKPTRGRAQRFSSANDSNAYVLSENNPRYRKPKEVDQESDDEDGVEKTSGSEQDHSKSSDEESSEDDHKGKRSIRSS